MKKMYFVKIMKIEILSNHENCKVISLKSIFVCWEDLECFNLQWSVIEFTKFSQIEYVQSLIRYTIVSALFLDLIIR